MLKSIFSRSPKCPNCGEVLSEKPSRKTVCPHCEKAIRVRQGKLVTEEQANILDWLDRLSYLDVSEKEFAKHRDVLSKQFGSSASVNDTVWRILNDLVLRYPNDKSRLEQVYREMAALVSKEGKDPTQYLEQAEEVRRSNSTRENRSINDRIFLGHDELAYIRKLRAQEQFEKAEEMLMKAEPSPAVLDEIRKIASAKAKIAKKEQDWKAVVHYLESYQDYAASMREYAIEMVNQAPPEHTDTDKKLLEEAKSKLS
jgi:hypothetical protein